MNDDLGNRMKEYEGVTQTSLLRRTPVIIRLDGRAFHTFTKKFTPDTDPSLKNGPFSHILHNLMVITSQALFHYIQNAQFVYTQSDEISILLKDWTRLSTDQWFGGNIQKITSISASMASTYFNFQLQRVPEWNKWVHESGTYTIPMIFPIPTYVGEIPLFDSRVFNLPKEEVVNYFIWRQQDATRNSINMLARFYFSHKELHQKSTSDVQDMLMLQKGINWNDLETWKKRGTAIIANNTVSSAIPVKADEEMPILTQDRDYIGHLLLAEEE